MLKKLPSTEVKNRFGAVLKEINRTGDPIMVLRDGKPVAVIMGVTEYEKLNPKALEKHARTTIISQAFGLWSDRGDLTDEWLKQSREEWKSDWSNGS